MRGLIAIARREVIEHRRVFLAAVVAGVLPLLLPPLRGVHGVNAVELRDGLALYIAGTFAVGLTLVLGFSAISGDLTNRRLGFYFARPLSSLSIWGGRLTGIALLAFGVWIIALAPAFVAAGGSLHTPVEGKLLPLVALAAAFLFAALAHAVSLPIRSRSPLLALDLFFLVTCAFVTLLASQALGSAFALEAWRVGMVSLGIVAALALCLAGFSAIAFGRTEIRDSHRAFSKLLWGVLLPASLGFAGFAMWVLSPTISSLVEVRNVRPAPVGDWVAVSGLSRGRGRDYMPSFLFDAATGRFLRTGNAFGWWANTILSADGRRAVWTTSSSPFTGYGLAWTDLTGQNVAKPVLLNGLFQTAPSCLVLSSDGSRLATIEPAMTRMDQVVRPPTLSVFEVPSGRSLLSSRVDSGRAWLSFRSNQTLRAYVLQSDETGKNASLVIMDVDLKDRKILPRSRIEGLEDLLFLAADRQGTRLLIHEAHSKRLTLYEAPSGRRLTVLGEGSASSRRASFLSDGRIALAESLGDVARRIRIFSAEGRELQTIPIAGNGPLNLAGEAAPGRLVVATRPGPSVQRTDSSVLLVDTSEASTRTLGQNLYPVAASGWWLPGDPSVGFQPGSQATRLFLTRSGGLVSIDFATGTRRVILGRKD